MLIFYQMQFVHMEIRIRIMHFQVLVYIANIHCISSKSDWYTQILASCSKSTKITYYVKIGLLCLL